MKTQLRLYLSILAMFAFTSAFALPAGRRGTVPARLLESHNSCFRPSGRMYPGTEPETNAGDLLQILRLKLVIDQYNYDDIVIGFDSAATAAYDPNEDSKYFPGLGSPEGLSSYSSDSVALSVNFLPLPGQTPDMVRIDVEAANSGLMTLECTQLDSLPQLYQVFLIDKYKQDTIDLKTTSAYAFSVDKKDSASFGSGRFAVMVRQNPALALKLTDFNALKQSGSSEITWDTENEAGTTLFEVERSSDGGEIFATIDSLQSNSSGSYSFVDKAPPEASDEYRLKLTDLNGTVSYSNVVTLLYAPTPGVYTSNVSIFPNPVSTVIHLAINPPPSDSIDSVSPYSGMLSLAAAMPENNNTYLIRIINISGVVLKTSTSGSANWQDNVSGLSSGTYIVTVSDAANNKVIGRSTFIKL